MFEIREEIDTDHSATYQVTVSAFRGRPYAGGDEQDVIDRLRLAGALVLSLVATEAEELIGQVTFSPVEIEDGTGPWFALGPVSVDPARQGEGIGSALIKDGLKRIEELGALGCILTGNPDYYCRFGFKLSPQNVPLEESEEYFQLKLLKGKQPSGRFSFHRAFYSAT